MNGNIWRTATVDQPAAESDSYWVRFPRQFHTEKDQVNDQTQILTFSFQLQAEAQPGNFEGKTCSCSFDSFKQLNGSSMLPVTPMVSVTTPATIYRGSKVSETTNPISSTEAPQPSVGGASVPSTPRCSTRSTKGVPPDCYTPLPRSEWISGCFICASYAVLGLIVSSVLQYRLVKHGTMWNIPHLWCILNFTLVTLRVNAIIGLAN